VTKALPYTENGISRVIEGARKAGLTVRAVSVTADGTITTLDESPLATVTAAASIVAAPAAADDADDADNWVNA
jgi:hypothetical protein